MINGNEHGAGGAQLPQVVLADVRCVYNDRSRAEPADFLDGLREVVRIPRRVVCLEPLISNSLERERQISRFKLRQEIRRSPSPLQRRSERLTACQPFPAQAGRAIDSEENWVSV